MAAYEIPGFSWTLPSNQDWSTANGQFRFCDVNSSGKAVYPGDLGKTVGVRQNKPKQEEATTIVSTGIVFVEASAALAVGATIGTDATGRAKAVGAGIAQGILLTASGAAGELVSVLLVGRLV